MDSEKGKINITPKKETGDIHPEFLSKVFYIKEKRIPFTHQETVANCGPLAIANGVQTLKSVHDAAKIPKDFPTSSEGIRKLLASDQNLRKWHKGIELETEIKKDTYALKGEHIVNLLRKLESESDLRIIVERFTDSIFVAPPEMKQKVKNADWLILHGNYHYKSFVRINGDTWVILDSMDNQPVEVNQQYIDETFKDVLPKILPTFIALKIEEKPKITITKKIT